MLVPGTAAPLRPEALPPVGLAEVARACGASIDEGAGAGVTVTGVTLRAQSVAPGDLFAALAGGTTHGARFAADAVAAGAAAVLTDAAGLALVRGAGLRTPVLVHEDPRSVLGGVSAQIYGRPSSRLTLIGITGTSGKTTTAYLTEAGLRAAGRVVGLIGTVETRIDGDVVPSSLTTPEAPDLQRLFAVMVERGVDTVVMEVSSHALALGRVDGCEFAVGAFTNLSQDHLDYHRTMDEYFAAKSLLFAAGSPARARRAVICVDDDWGAEMAALAREAGPEVPVETVATAPTDPGAGAGRTDDAAGASGIAAADWAVTGCAPEAGSSAVEFRDPDGGAHTMTVPLPGAYNVANALVAVATCAAAGVDPDVAARGLAQVRVPGRLERVDRGQDFLALVDYAHKPAAVAAVLRTLAAERPSRIAVVLGAGGDRDELKRPEMGRAAALIADLVIVTDDNPRSEDPAVIRAAVLTGARAGAAERGDGRSPVELREIGDRAAAIAAAVAWAGTGDVVLVAGKGHETGQEAGGVVTPFDDRAVLADALGRAAARAADDGAAVAGAADDSAAVAGDAAVSAAVGSGAGSVEPVRLVAVAPETDVTGVKRALREFVALAAAAGAGSAHRGGVARRTFALVGELPGDPAENARCVEHDLLGRQAVRLAVDKVIAVGAGRTARALHQGAVMEGSWGDEAALALGPAEAVAHLRSAPGYRPGPGDVILVAGADPELVPAVVAFLTEEVGLPVRRERLDSEPGPEPAPTGAGAAGAQAPEELQPGERRPDEQRQGRMR